MKTLPVILLAALVATILLPVRFEIAISLLSSAGMAALLMVDYAQRPRRIRFRLMPANAASAAHSTSLQLAA